MIVLTSSFFLDLVSFSDKCNECEGQATHGGYLGEREKPSRKVIYVRDMAALRGLIISMVQLWVAVPGFTTGHLMGGGRS